LAMVVSMLMKPQQVAAIYFDWPTCSV
jgi:hypothetical protein